MLIHNYFVTKYFKVLRYLLVVYESKFALFHYRVSELTT